MKIINVWWCLDCTVMALVEWPNGHQEEIMLGWSLMQYLVCDVEPDCSELPF